MKHNVLCKIHGMNVVHNYISEIIRFSEQELFFLKVEYGCIWNLSGYGLLWASVSEPYGLIF